MLFRPDPIHQRIEQDAKKQGSSCHFHEFLDRIVKGKPGRKKFRNRTTKPRYIRRGSHDPKG